MTGEAGELPPQKPDTPKSSGVELIQAGVWPTQEEPDEINPEPMFDHDISWGYVHDRLREGSLIYQAHQERWKAIREHREEFSRSVKDVKIYTSAGYNLATDWGVAMIGPDGKKWADKTFAELVDYLGITAKKLLDIFPVYPDAPATVNVLEAIFDGMGREGVQKLANVLGKHVEFRYRGHFSRQESALRFSADPEEKVKKSEHL